MTFSKTLHPSQDSGVRLTEARLFFPVTRIKTKRPRHAVDVELQSTTGRSALSEGCTPKHTDKFWCILASVFWTYVRYVSRESALLVATPLPHPRITPQRMKVQKPGYCQNGKISEPSAWTSTLPCIISSLMEFWITSAYKTISQSPRPQGHEIYDCF